MVEQSVHTTSEGVKNRVARGRGDVGRVTAHGDYYEVRSSSRADVVHMVNLSHPEIGEVCRCEDFKRYQVPCRHIYAVTIFVARNGDNCRRGPKIIRH